MTRAHRGDIEPRLGLSKALLALQEHTQVASREEIEREVARVRVLEGKVQVGEVRRRQRAQQVALIEEHGQPVWLQQALGLAHLPCGDRGVAQGFLCVTLLT